MPPINTKAGAGKGQGANPAPEAGQKDDEKNESTTATQDGETEEQRRAREAQEKLDAENSDDAAKKAAEEEAAKAAASKANANAAKALGKDEEETFTFSSPRAFTIHAGSGNKGIEVKVVKGANTLPISFRDHWYLEANGCTVPEAPKKSAKK